MDKRRHHYSGDNSKPFWRRVNRLPDMQQREAYALGVALQNLEECVLNALRNSELEVRRREGRARR